VYNALSNMSRPEHEGAMATTAGRLGYCARYAWCFAVLRRLELLIYSISFTDRFNLSCEGCRVAREQRLTIQSVRR